MEAEAATSDNSAILPNSAFLLDVPVQDGHSYGISVRSVDSVRAISGNAPPDLDFIKTGQFLELFMSTSLMIATLLSNRVEGQSACSA
ncbi:hypothetical protein C5748_23390 [Phyllobacterium phragmitis]|uniref:Uncharacterized protein n=1 Tax=Phyllobacterium phragmitis TaxID=2670329 RepID=A0A2S9IKL1_9HYPH|nr:hypothetical protein C5748_23390 [Phyllobacterium phragmitis]